MKLSFVSVSYKLIPTTKKKEVTHPRPAAAPRVEPKDFVGGAAAAVTVLGLSAGDIKHAVETAHGVFAQRDRQLQVAVRGEGHQLSTQSCQRLSVYVAHTRGQTPLNCSELHLLVLMAHSLTSRNMRDTPSHRSLQWSWWDSLSQRSLQWSGWDSLARRSLLWSWLNSLARRSLQWSGWDSLSQRSLLWTWWYSLTRKSLSGI